MRENHDSTPWGIDTPRALQDDIAGMREALTQFRNGAMSGEEFRRYRLHRGIYGQRADQADFCMVRVKVPYGELTAHQLGRLGEIAGEFADGLAHITTRQDIQFHWVRLDVIPEVMERLAEAGMTTREACGNTVRNIVGSPLAGVDPHEAFDVTPYARTLARHLLRNPLNQQLPRKFKISFSGSSDERDGIVPWIHDIGFVATMKEIRGEERKGFAAYAGGGLGAQPRVADLFEEFMPVEYLIPTTEALLKVFNELGNRQNRNKARMKYVVWKLGSSEFQRRVFEERDRIIAEGFPLNAVDASADSPGESGRDADVPGGAGGFRDWFATNTVRQKQRGFHAVYVNPVIGDVTAAQLLFLAHITRRYARGFVRTTPQQDLLLRWVPTTDLPDLHRELETAGLGQSGARDIANVTACPGADTCNLGITHSRALGGELTRLFHDHPEWAGLLRDLRVKISGCPNSCGQHHVASIGLHGATKHAPGGQIPSYLLTLGGGLNTGRSAFGETIGRLPARRVTEGIVRILKQFLSDRREGEVFPDYIDRVGARSFRFLIADLTEIPAGHGSADLLVDLGESTQFQSTTGEGECAS